MTVYSVLDRLDSPRLLALDIIIPGQYNTETTNRLLGNVRNSMTHTK